MLTEKFYHSLDPKNRIIIPVKHRVQLGESFVITQSVDGCLIVYSMDEWEKFTAKLALLPRSKMAKVRRFIFSNASEVTPDSQGRVILTPELIAFAGIDKNAVIVGCGSYDEIWSLERWNAENGEENIAEISELMMELDI